jgi:Terpene synthase family 2, C-terminal metal binding
MLVSTYPVPAGIIWIIHRHPWGVGMGMLASLVPGSDQPIVRAHVARLQQAAREQSWPGPAAPQLRRRVCCVVAAIAPALPPRPLSLLARYALWSFVFDDALEAAGADPDTLARFRDEVAGIAAGSRQTGGDPVRVALSRMLDDLARYDPGGEVVRRFGDAVRDAAAAEVEQVLLGRAVAAGIAPPPTAEQYLALGARSANYRSFAFLLLAVVAGALPGSTLDRMDPALWYAARAVRLGNDLPSVARDRGRAGLNIVALRTAGGEPVTRQQVIADIDRYVRAHDDALAPLTDAGPAVPALRRSLRVTVELFRMGGVR